MSNEHKSQSGKKVGSNVGLGARPPARINGKLNPEYLRWYRRSKPEKYRKQHDKDRAKLVALRHEAGQPSNNQTKCVECGMVYDRMEARIRGFRIFKGHRGLRCACDECA